jgi:hypothetical protein
MYGGEGDSGNPRPAPGLCEGAGSKKTEQTGILLTVGDRSRVDMKVEIGATQESVTVEAEPVAVQPKPARSAASSPERKCRNAPPAGEASCPPKPASNMPNYPSATPLRRQRPYQVQRPARHRRYPSRPVAATARDLGTGAPVGTRTGGRRHYHDFKHLPVRRRLSRRHPASAAAGAPAQKGMYCTPVVSASHLTASGRKIKSSFCTLPYCPRRRGATGTDCVVACVGEPCVFPSREETVRTQ